ncbi:alpha-ketoglutarate-dependent dioxygenase AlkB, partial [Vibrio antiquarius]
MHQQGDLFDGTQWQEVERGKLYYDPYFLSHLEADHYFDQLLKTLPWHQERITMFGKSVL